MLLANTFRAFRHRDYSIFWSGLFLGHTGTLIQTTAQSWLLFQLTDSPFYLGLEGLTNRGRIMSLFGLINRGLGPMGSFPFGLIATVIGAPWTVAICGGLTIALVAHVVLYRSHLRGARSVGEN